MKMGSERWARPGKNGADMLGISEHIARRHYANWSAARQERIATIMRALQGGEGAVVTAAVPAKTPAIIQ